MTNLGMRRQMVVVIVVEGLKTSLQGRNNGQLSSRKHLTNMQNEISMDSIPNLPKANSKTGLTSLALNMTTDQTFMALKTKTPRAANKLTSTSETPALLKPEHRKNANNNRNELSDGIPKTQTLGLETRMIVKNFIQARLVRKRVTNRRRTGRRACLKTSKPTTNSTLKSLREPGVRRSSTVLSSSNSKTTDTKSRLRPRRKQRGRPTTKSLKQALTPISTL